MRFLIRIIVLYVCVLSAHAQDSQPAPTPSAYLTDEHWLLSVLKVRQAEVQKLAAQRLQNTYPSFSVPRVEIGVDGNARRREESANNGIISTAQQYPGVKHIGTSPATAGRRAPGAHSFSVDWSKGAGAFRVNPASIVLLPEITKVDFVGSQQGADFDVPQRVTYWNCDPKEPLDINATYSRKDRDQQVSRETNVKEVQDNVRVKVSASGSASSGIFSASHSAEAEFQKVVTTRYEREYERLKETEINEVRVQTFKLPKLSSRESGISSTNSTQVYRLKGVVAYDAELLVELPGIWGPVMIGRLSEYLSENDRSRAMDAFVQLSLKRTNWIGAGAVMSYGSAEACDAAVKAQEAFGAVATTKVFPTSQLVPVMISVGKGPMDIAVSESVPPKPVQLSRLLTPFAAVQSVDVNTGPAQCRASLTGSGSISGSDARVRHGVSISSCPFPRFKSSGRATFSIKVELDEGRSELLSGFAVLWRSESGASFSVSDAERVGLSGVKRVIEVGPYYVDSCSCFAD